MNNKIEFKGNVTVHEGSLNNFINTKIESNFNKGGESKNIFDELSAEGLNSVQLTRSTPTALFLSRW